jgi:glycolate oxidase
VLFRSKLAKSSSGYALKDLLIGSEGTLAVITEAILKVLPKQTEDISLLAPFNDMREAMACVPKLILSSINPTAIEFITRNSIELTERYLGRKFPRLPSDYALLILFDGQSEEAVKKSFGDAAELCLESGAADVFILDTDERKSAAWTARGAYLEAFKSSTDELDECDIVVPRNRIVDFTDALYTMGERYGLRVPYFGHAGDGNLHIYFCRDDMPEGEWREKLDSGFSELYRLADSIGGLPSGEHGIGWAKKRYLKDSLGERQIEIMRGIKRVFDPNGILNPDKII